MSGLDYTLAELDLAGVPTLLLTRPESTFIGDDGHVWTVLGPSFVPGYHDVMSDDGRLSMRSSELVRRAGLREGGEINAASIPSS